MTKNVNICDRCKKEETTSFGYPIGWKSITLQFDHQYTGGCYLLCKDCLKKLGVIEPKKEGSLEKEKPLAERLLDIIEEIVYNRQ